MLNKQKERSKEMKCKKMRDVIASAALLLALTVPSAATGQSTDMGQSIDNFFFLNESEDHGGLFRGTEEPVNEVSWSDFDNDNPLPTGGGLLVLALSGACYAGAKMKRLKLKD